MARSIKLVIPGIPPSLNEYVGREKSQDYRSDKSVWTANVAWRVKACKLPEPFRKADVTLEYFFPDNRRRDPDNYAGKMLLDGLTRGGAIVDDSFEHINLHLAKGGVDKERPRVEISVVEA